MSNLAVVLGISSFEHQGGIARHLIRQTSQVLQGDRQVILRCQ
jgi:hypothetical protein